MKKRYVLLLAILVIALAATAVFFLFINKPQPAPKGPLSDEECSKFVGVKVSNIEFGRSKTTFSKDSEIYPAVNISKGSVECGKRITIALIDSNNKTILEKAYNSPPSGEGGETGYGNYNPNKNLAAGTYTIECYYGDALAKNFQINVQ